jgi:chromatin structure-remodeling complex protein RSC7
VNAKDEDDEYEEDDDVGEVEDELEEDDEEESLAEDEEEEVEEAEAEAEAEAKPVKRRGRPPKRPPVEDGGLSDIKRIRVQEAPVKGRRGRKPAIAPEGSLTTEDGRILAVVDDEYDLSEDEEGENKITKDGELLDGRQFRVRTFKVKGKGDRLYMLSTEPARCMGFRDSYLLFQKHRLLYKVVLSQEEKYDLIDRDIIPHSYKGRVIGLVTARSVFREFGAKIVVGGKWITDDYYATKLRELGRVTEGTLADPQDVLPPQGTPYNTKQFVAWHGASSVYHQSAMVHTPQPTYESLELQSVKALKQTTNMSEENWMYQHALSIRDFEKALLQGRMVIQRGLRDPYTGLTFVPSATQPTEVRYLNIDDQQGKKKLVYETKMQLKGFERRTGLTDIALELFEDCVDEETKKAILKQQEYEKLTV